MPGSPTTPGWPSARVGALGHFAFHYTDSVGTRNQFSIAGNGWPARSPADASLTSSRMPAHGLGPMRVATPSSQWTCTTYSSPVSRRTCVKTPDLIPRRREVPGGLGRSVSLRARIEAGSHCCRNARRTTSERTIRSVSSRHLSTNWTWLRWVFAAVVPGRPHRHHRSFGRQLPGGHRRGARGVPECRECH